MTIEEIKELLPPLPKEMAAKRCINVLTFKIGNCTLSMRQWNKVCTLTIRDAPVNHDHVAIMNDIAVILQPKHSEIFNL